MKTYKAKLKELDGRPTLRSTRLFYQQVKDYVLQQIAEGHLQAGDVLPPEKVLAKILGRGVHTVRHALDELSEEKIVRRVRGKGTLVNGKESSSSRAKLDVFALIVPEVGVSLYPSLMKGFIEAASHSHNQVLTCNCNSAVDTNVQGDMILQLLNKKNVGGVAIVPPVTPMPSYQMEVLHGNGIPVVFCHRRPSGFAAPLVTWPWKEVGQRAGNEIIRLGHHRIAFLSSGCYEVSAAHLEGLRAAMMQHGLELPEESILFGTRSDTPLDESRVSYHRLTEMLQSPDRPTAVFCSDTMEAEHVFLEAIRLGLRVPEDLSLVGFGCQWREGVLSQRLAAVTIDEVELGRRAAFVLNEIQAGSLAMNSEQVIHVPVTFSLGQSLGAVPNG